MLGVVACKLSARSGFGFHILDVSYDDLALMGENG